MTDDRVQNWVPTVCVRRDAMMIQGARVRAGARCRGPRARLSVGYFLDYDLDLGHMDLFDN